MLVHAGLTESLSARPEARAAIARLVQRSQQERATRSRPWLTPVPRSAGTGECRHRCQRDRRVCWSPINAQAAAQAHLERWVDSGEELHAPTVLPYEVANVVTRLVFDGNLQANSVAETWSDLAALGMSFQPFDLAGDGPAAATIATQLWLRHATGSTYIHLAQQLGTHVWTLDGPLARNGADLGLPAMLVT